MADTVSNTTFSFDINSKVLEAFNALPSPCSDDTVIALGARLYIDTNHFISDLSEINRLTRKLCDDSCGHGIYTYSAYKLSQVLGEKLDLEKLRKILNSITDNTINEICPEMTLDEAAEILTGVCADVLQNKRHEPNTIACALLCLTLPDETGRYDFAYDTAIPALDEHRGQISDTERIHRNVVFALELLQNAERALNDVGGEDIMNDPMLLGMLFINALCAFEGDRIYNGYNALSLDDVFGGGLVIEEYDNQCDEPDEFDELDKLDWDEFYSYKE